MLKIELINKEKTEDGKINANVSTELDGSVDTLVLEWALLTEDLLRELNTKTKDGECVDFELLSEIYEALGKYRGGEE